MATVRWVDAPTACTLAPANLLLNDFAREVLPGEPDTPVEKMVSDIASSPAYRRARVLEAVEGAEVVGCAVLFLDEVVGRTSLAWVKALVVAPEHRRRHVGTSMVRAIVERSRKEARDRLQVFVAAPHEPGKAFAAALGGRTTGTITLLVRVRTRDLDRAMLEQWVARAQEHADDYSLVCFDGPCPDQWLHQLTELTAVMNTIPRSTKEAATLYTAEQVLQRQEAHVAAAGWAWTVCALHRPSMRLVGFTELGGSRHQPWLAAQGDTGVRPGHRNRGLTKWMKAVNALRLLDERPEVEVIESLNSHVNVPMLSVNTAMGFRTVLEWVEWAWPASCFLDV